MKALKRFFNWWWAEYVAHVGRFFPHDVEVLPPGVLFRGGEPILCPKCRKVMAIPKIDILRGERKSTGSFTWLESYPGVVKDFDCWCGYSVDAGELR